MEGIVLLWREKNLFLCAYLLALQKKDTDYNKNVARGISPHSLLISSMLASSASLHKTAAWFGESASLHKIAVWFGESDSLHKIAAWFGESDVGGSADSVFLTCSPVSRARSIHCCSNWPKH